MNGNTNGEIQTQSVTDSESTGTELRVPTTSETVTDLPILSPSSGQSDIGLTIGVAISVIVAVLLLTLTVVIIIAVLFKKHGKTMKGVTDKNVTVPTTTNQAYGLTHHDRERVEENIYNYPEVDLGDAIEAKQNEAYATTTDIITEGNQAYATNITTEKNEAYKPVTAIEAVDEYDYI